MELVQPESKRNLKRAFSSLIDVMKDMHRLQEREQKIREMEELNKRQDAALEKLKEEFSHAVLSRQDTLGKELAGDLEKQISSLSLVAVNLAKKKLETKYLTELKDSQLALDSERTKTFKSLEAFLATLPFSLLDKSINLKLLSRVYSANVEYDCANDIQFEFSLDCNKSTVLNKEFKLTSPDGEIKLPISLGKSWLKKEPSPDYEELGRYTLSAAEVTEAHLATTYEYPEKSSMVSIIMSKRDSHASLTVEYQSADAKVNVTSDPSLNKFLNSEQIDKSSDALRSSILELENYKIDLVRLTSDGVVVYGDGKLDVSSFVPKAWQIIAPEVKAALSGDAASDNEETLDQAFVRQKIASLGERGNALLVSLNPD